jgi:hypothetical protein
LKGRSDRQIATLIAEMDREDHEAAEDAAESLKALGPIVLPQLREAAPRLGEFGQLCAIEVFEELKDSDAADVLIALLTSEEWRVRIWSATALADLRVVEAVPHLRRADAEAKARGEAPNWTERAGIRAALDDLGARNDFLPERARALTLDLGFRAWKPTDLPVVIDDLADAEQVILSFSYMRRWHRWRGEWADLLTTERWKTDLFTLAQKALNYGWDGWSIPDETDWTARWSDLVAAARQAAHGVAVKALTPRGVIAVVDWIAETDR